MSEIFTTFAEKKEKVGYKPYVVSGDINLLLQEWAKKRGFTLPSQGFLNMLRNNFTSYMTGLFKEFEFVPEDDLVEGLCKIVSETGLQPVSLDRVYFRSPFSLDITRLVDEQGSSKGLGKRPGTESLLRQFRSLREKGIDEVVLVDDVVFTGDLLLKTKRLLQKMRIDVPYICTGIAIGEGVKLLNSEGVGVKWVRYYNDVIDEVCERDFYPGVPYSGRSLINRQGQNVGVPYLKPFGKPDQWASIPMDRQKEFSDFCIEQTQKLFSEIELCSNRPVMCWDIDRKTKTIRNQAIPFVEALDQMKIYGEVPF